MTTDKTPEILDIEPEILDDAQDAPNEAAPQTDPEIEQIVEDFIDVGKMWAHHGVTIGKMAMTSSARTFQVTANALETIGRRLAPRPER